MDPVEKIVGKGKRKCKYCGQVHVGCPFTDCHNPAEELPDSLEDHYRGLYGGDY